RQADGGPELVGRALAEDLAILVVVPERERVGALRSLATDGLALGEDARHDVLHWNARVLAGDGCPRQGASPVSPRWDASGALLLHRDVGQDREDQDHADR